MAILQTKYVAVGTFTYGSLANYGFNTGLNIGTISNTSGGTSNVNLDSVYSGADVYTCNYANNGTTENVVLTLTGNRANSGWATMTVGSYSYSRTAATYSYDSNNNQTSWVWSSTNLNPFGTSGNVKVEWDDGAPSTTYSVTAPASINEGSSGTMNVSTTNVANGTTLYWTVEPSGDFGTSSGSFSISSNAGSFTVTPSADQTTEGAETGTIRIRTGSTSGTIVASDTFTINDTSTTPAGPGLGATISTYTGNPTRYNSNGSVYTTATTTVVATSAYTHGLGNCASNTRYWASYTSGASGDTATYSTISPIGRTYNTATSRTLAGMGSSSASIALPSSYGGSLVYIWADLAGTTVTSSTTMTCTGASYYIEYPNDAISLSPSTTTVSSSSTSDVTVNVTGDTSGTQYRLFTNNINRWVSTYNGGGSVTNDFTISYDEAANGQPGTGFTELPSTGNTYTYFSQCRVTAGVNDGANSGGGALWINTGDSFTVSRSVAGTYTVTSPSSVNEGSNLSFSITTTNITNGTTVGWTLSGLQSGDYTTSASSPATIQNNAATVTFAIVNDNVADGNKTATLTLASTDSTGASTGSPSSSTTVVDTSNPGGGGGTGGTPPSSGAGTYGLLIRNSNDTQTIIDGSSRITNFLASDSIDTNSQSSKTMFTNFDCSEKTEIGFLVSWDGALFSNPTITRRSSSLGGIEVTKNANDTGSSTAGTAVIELVRF